MDTPISRAEHEEFARRIDDEQHRQNRRLELLEDNVRQTQALTISVEKMACSVQQMAEELKSQGERLDSLEEEPGENWEKLKAGIIGAIASGIGVAIVTSIINYL